MTFDNEIIHKWFINNADVSNFQICRFKKTDIPFKITPKGWRTISEIFMIRNIKGNYFFYMRRLFGNY